MRSPNTFPNLPLPSPSSGLHVCPGCKACGTVSRVTELRGQRDCLSLCTEETLIVPRAPAAEASHMHLCSLPHSKVQHGPRKGTWMSLTHVSGLACKLVSYRNLSESKSSLLRQGKALATEAKGPK